MAAGMISDQEKKGFLIHLAAYVVVNAALVAVNLATEPQEWWFIWPLLGWGIGIGAHALALYLHARSADGGQMARPEARGFITHLFVYVAVNLLLVIVNLRTTPNVLWFQWPLLGWGLGLVVHGLLIGTGRATPPAAARPAGAAAPAKRAGKSPARSAAKSSAKSPAKTASKSPAKPPARRSAKTARAGAGRTRRPPGRRGAAKKG